VCGCCDAPAGDNAEIGKINKLVSQVEQVKTNLLIQMEILGRWLAIIVVLIAVGAFLLALLHAHEPFDEAFKSAVAIAVAMIPEGLPALVTIVLALGTTKMAEHQAIIRQLPCVEVSKAVAGSCPPNHDGIPCRVCMQDVAVGTAWQTVLAELQIAH
jgi:P-type E1-E2 ATPase